MTKIKQLTYHVQGVPDSIVAGQEICENFIITELGIYGIPGTSFLINGGNGGEIILNGSGLLSLGNDQCPIVSLKLNPESAENLYSDGTHCLILDIKYEEVHI